MERDGPLMEGLKQSMTPPDSCVESEGTIQGNSVCRFRLRNIIDISITGQQKKPKLRDRNQTKRHCTMTDRIRCELWQQKWRQNFGGHLVGKTDKIW